MLIGAKRNLAAIQIVRGLEYCPSTNLYKLFELPCSPTVPYHSSVYPVYTRPFESLHKFDRVIRSKLMRALECLSSYRFDFALSSHTNPC